MALAGAVVLTVGFELALWPQSAAGSMWVLELFTLTGCYTVFATGPSLAGVR